MERKVQPGAVACLFDRFGDVLEILVTGIGEPAWITGGTVRDLLLGKEVRDLDMTVLHSPEVWAKTLIEGLGGGRLVELGQGGERLYRVIEGERQVDIVGLRYGATTIEEDLAARDLTINSLAIALHDLVDTGGGGGERARRDIRLLDVTGGVEDLRSGCVRHCPGAFVDDPLRMVRACRFVATLDFRMAQETIAAIRESLPRLASCAVERITAELDLIVGSEGAVQGLAMLDEAGLLQHLLPELKRGKGERQPEFHHLDVYDHSLEVLDQLGKILARPEHYYPDNLKEIADYLCDQDNIRSVKWAGLLHDIGKPESRGVHPDQPGRVTFHNHDQVGSELVKEIGGRLRWSSRLTDQVVRLVAMHMHPFHLCNVMRDTGGISPRATLKLVQRARDQLPGLFLVAMGDSLASRGERKPQEMETELRNLFKRVKEVRTSQLQPVVDGPKLLGGNDLIAEFGLVPGPIFSRILKELELARVEGIVKNRKEAVHWVRDFLQNGNKSGTTVDRSQDG